MPRFIRAALVFAVIALPFSLLLQSVAPAQELTAAEAQAKALDQAILAEAKTKSEIMANLTYLSDMIGPRLTGSENLRRANDWTAEKMKSYGLENVHLEPYEIPVGWERGTATARFIEPSPGRPILIASAGWSPGTKGKIEADVVIFKATKREDLAQYKGKLKNAVILRGEPRKQAPVNTPSPNPGERRGPGGPGGGGSGGPGGGRPGGGDGQPRGDFQGMMAFAQEVRDFLAAEGAAAIFTDSNKPHGLLVTTGSWRGRERATPQEAIPQLFVAHEHYAQLWRLASRPDAKTRIEIEVNNKFIPGPVTVYNTVGEIKGSEKSDEFVVVGAHLDSWDLAQGTTDNGTGSCITLEVARILAKSEAKPKRTVRFVLFSGEEQGLHGSRAYCERHKADLPKTSMALVHDTGTGKVISIGLQGRDVLKPIFERELAGLKEIGLKEITTRSMGGTDHQSFERAGVPGFACNQDMGEYRFTHHTQSDTLDKANEADLIQGAQVMSVAAMRVANLDKLLPRERREPKKDADKKEEKKDAEKKDPDKKVEKEAPELVAAPRPIR